jgi:hypothetical protein
LALLAQYVDATWRRQRCAALETGTLAAAMPETADGCPEGVHPTVWAMGQAWMARSREINRLSLHESRLARLAERVLDRLLAIQAARKQAEAEAELALASQIAETPSPAAAGEGGDPRSGEGESLPSGEDPRGQGTAWTQSPSPARRPDPHPQEREREQDQALTPELALLSRKAA